ncbi:hypothetical protein [Halorussus sp. MSC15.2]|uniref:hypothetical protein n=1 Tax=Halorussus sp. MSC15.2 TaxID=2283638 RepID=UPI001F0800E6|nr:hypothetical protein [Halorussus sp. MSC15.2]
MDGGEVIGRTPCETRGNGADNSVVDSMVCAGRYDYLEPLRHDVSFETPRRYAERIAAEFDEATWGVDFVLDTRGDWYCTEFNFNGVYWNRLKEQWWDMCGQGDFEAFGPTELHSAALWGVRPESTDGSSERWW